MNSPLILSLKYPESRDIFHHPTTQKGFESLMNQMVKFNEIDDTNGVYITAMQLIPRVLELDNDVKESEPHKLLKISWNCISCKTEGTEPKDAYKHISKNPDHNVMLAKAEV